MQLREWQNQFQTLVLNDFAAPQIGPAAHDNLVFLQQEQEREQRLNIYQNAYHLRLSEALSTNFSVLHQLLGDAAFYQAARQFLKQHPPETTSIRWFGEGFAEWLAQQNPFSEQPAISELAKFEWALRHALDAADAERIQTNYMEQIPPEQWGLLYFSLHPSLSILPLQWNAVTVWQAIENNQEPPAPQQTPAKWLVYRQEPFMNFLRSASDAEIEALLLIAEGKSFGDLCEHIYELMQDPEQAILQSATWLKTWIEEGLLVPCKKNGNASDK